MIRTTAFSAVLIAGFVLAATPAFGLSAPPLVRSAVQPYRHIYVENRAGAAFYRWHVGHAVRAWDRAHRLHVEVGPCRPRAGCVEVYSDPERISPAVGVTGFSDRVDTGRVWAARITLLPRHGWTRHVRRCAAAHEIGHALGLGHAESDASVMYYVCGPDSPTGPTRMDLRAATRAADWAVANLDRADFRG